MSDEMSDDELMRSLSKKRLASEPVSARLDKVVTRTDSARIRKAIRALDHYRPTIIRRVIDHEFKNAYPIIGDANRAEFLRKVCYAAVMAWDVVDEEISKMERDCAVVERAEKQSGSGAFRA